ncbi:MAG: hypothetical protein ACRBCT_06200 [Alphaproteobacteria bacterium]
MDYDLELVSFEREKRREAEFVKPQDTLRKKVGFGGLGDEILNQAQRLLEESTEEFEPLAKLYLDELTQAIEATKNAGPMDDFESFIGMMLHPILHLKAHGAMFNYHLITQIADRLVQFIELIDTPDIEALEIILAFHTTMKAVIAGKITGDGGEHGKNLLAALHEACSKYFKRH